MNLRVTLIQIGQFSMNKVYVFFILIFFVTNCKKDKIEQSSIKPFGERKIFMALTPGLGDNNLSNALEKALEMGFDGPGDLNLDWGIFEPSIGQYEDPDGIIAWNKNKLQGKPLHLTLAPIQTTYKSLPVELQNNEWSDSIMIETYINALTYLKTQLNGINILTVSIGNEVDVILAADSSAWNSYTSFFNQVKIAAKNLWPNAQIGVKITSEVISSTTNLSSAFGILSSSDAILTTYYPKVSDFLANKQIVFNDFNSLIKVFPNKPIHLLEVGFPTSSLLNSSEVEQKYFVQLIFKNWDIFKDKINTVTFVWLFELSQNTLDNLALLYGSNDPEFVNFLGSLGYLSFDKKPKDAANVLERNIKIRKGIKY